MGTPLLLMAIPYGCEFGVGECFRSIFPLRGSSLPTMLATWSVNHSKPWLSNTAVCGSSAFGSGILYSVTAPVRGSSLPMNAPVFPVYQMLPSLSSTRPWGPEWAVLSGYSLNCPVFGSSRPSTLAICPEYQTAPSRVASGSCGRDPGVGTVHTLIETRAGPGRSTPAGFDFSGKFLDR